MKEKFMRYLLQQLEEEAKKQVQEEKKPPPRRPRTVKVYMMGELVEELPQPK